MTSTKDTMLALAKTYYDETFAKKPFEPGKTVLPANGKVLDAEDLQFLIESSLDMWLTSGRFSKTFEKEIAQVFERRFGLFVNSGSSANLTATAALTSVLLKNRQLQPGDEVITPAAGFPTTLNPALQYGLVPVFVDIDLSIHNVTPELIEAAITPKTKLIAAAHTLGNPFDSKAIAEICKKHNIWFLEDCCDALGAKIDGHSVGSYGDIATCSFYPAHHITTGEGGAVMTSNPMLKKTAESFRDWGRDCFCPTGAENSCGKRYEWQMGDLPFGYDHKYIYTHLGFNLKATDMQAALGVSQLKKLPEFVAKRQSNAAFLKSELIRQGMGEYMSFPEALPHAEPSWFGFLITLTDSRLKRAKILAALNDAKVGTRLLFGGNMTKQPAYRDIPRRIVGTLEHTDTVMNHSFYIGVWPGLGTPELTYMVETLVSTIKRMV